MNILSGKKKTKVIEQMDILLNEFNGGKVYDWEDRKEYINILI